MNKVSRQESKERNTSSKVVLVRCDSYDLTEIRTALRRGMELLGGIEQFVASGEQILLKPNLLSARLPAENVTTHPNLVRVVAELCQEEGIRLSLGDSSSRDSWRLVYTRTGMLLLAEELGIALADFETEVPVSFPKGKQNKRFVLARGVVEVDGIISLPKLKTHHLTRLTAAIKNQFGCIPGILKPEFHVRLPGVEEFSKMLVDLNRCLQPRLFILDAIEAMEGNGPGSGERYPMHLIAISSDPVALDSAVCRLLNLSPDLVRTNFYGEQFGLGWMQAERIELLGDDPKYFLAPKFKIERAPAMPFNLAWRYRLLKNWISAKPVIEASLCIKCGECVEQCPVAPKALRWGKSGKQQPPQYDYQSCIRCYCCQEVCRHRAIRVKIPIIRSILNWFYKNLWMRL